MDIFFDNEFRNLIPTLQPDERTQLEASLKAEGNRDPIIIWKETQLLLDGHNRYDICARLGIPLKPALEMSFVDRNTAMVWIIQNQFGRRNLQPYVIIKLRMKLADLLHPKGIENISKAVTASNTNRASPTFQKSEKLEVIPESERINSVKEVAKANEGQEL